MSVRVVSPDETEFHDFVAAQTTRPGIRKWFWEDNLARNAVQSYRFLFMNSNNFVTSIDDAGILAFVPVLRGFRAMLYGIAWDVQAMRAADDWRASAAAAMLALNLQVIDGVTATGNILAARAMDQAGMHFRGYIPGFMHYNGEAHDACWFEGTRSDLGLPMLEEISHGWKPTNTSPANAVPVRPTPGAVDPIAEPEWEHSGEGIYELGSILDGVQPGLRGGSAGRSGSERAVPVRSSEGGGNGEIRIRRTPGRSFHRFPRFKPPEALG